MNAKEYLGDSVYAEYDGYGLTLTTENGTPDDPSNSIYIEQPVFAALVKFVERINARSIARQQEQAGKGEGVGVGP